ncbi:MAG: putative cobalt-precorrin-6Y C(15)-methyltransferase (decarboxylating) [Candidatus Bathyarchaeota archaeon BA1]|nr:MAG: putative cobalt-precorrin-6Y C(15)-methyltransferase (decarboxylating) [Candidatus Bathyarchaeota archaeon BA1]
MEVNATSRDQNPRGSIDRRSLIRPFDTLLLLREGQWPLVEVRPTSIRIMETPSPSIQRFKVPYVPTSMETAKRMLEIAKVGSEDVVYDLGCGDGRILILAVEEFGAKGAVGYEIRKELYKSTQLRIEHRGLQGRIRLVNGDLFEADLSKATVITLYLNGSANERLKPKLERETRPGTRVVSHDFEISEWQPTRKEILYGDTIYLYVVPEAFQRLGSPRP